MYLAAERRKKFAEDNQALINKVVEELRASNLTLNDAKHILSIVEERICQEAKI
jgi:hypothetical protein